MSYKGPPIPARMLRLPRDHAGRPIPWFVATLDDGTRDARIADPAKFVHAVRFRVCWVCGQPNGRRVAFVIGPMCAVNRITSEPGCHRDCAIYSATACPFLATPQMQRRERGLDEMPLIAPRGVMVKRNPGVCVVWVTSRWGLKSTPTGPLIELGEPSEVSWYAEGRCATNAEALAAINSGLPLLDEACDRDDDPASSRAQLKLEVAATVRLLPA